MKVWLITGIGNGLGRSIAEAALAADDNVVAGARRTEELAPLVAQYGGLVKPVTLEVRDESAAKAAVQSAVNTFGRLEVLVNNDGYGQFAPFEQMSVRDFQAVMDTCFYGVVYKTRAAVPVMGKQKSGHIFQVSSADAEPIPGLRIISLVFENLRFSLLAEGQLPSAPRLEYDACCPQEDRGTPNAAKIFRLRPARLLSHGYWRRTAPTATTDARPSFRTIAQCGRTYLQGSQPKRKT
jgi:NAD(P)-dependent dehydrogenase (short-subunit alcohol dehydrogenase family)